MDKFSEIRKKRVILLVKLDSENVFRKLNDRLDESMRVFSQKRTREHFSELFLTRYFDVSLEDLTFFSEEVIVALNTFYQTLDEMRWYLMVTEDMPSTVNDKARYYFRELSKHYDTLKLYIVSEFELQS
jgi:hypothetical protein